MNENCCCGHDHPFHWKRLGACMRPGCSCKGFHGIGEGHNPLWFRLFLVLLVVGMVFGLWRVHRGLEKVRPLVLDTMRPMPGFVPVQTWTSCEPDAAHKSVCSDLLKP